MKYLNVLTNFTHYIQKIFPNILGYINRGELILLVPYNSVYKVIKFLKNHTQTQFKQLSEITCIDYPYKLNRFEIVYVLLSIRFNTRITISTFVNEYQYVESVVSLYRNANWFEREAWDMFGVYFLNHPDLRRLLTDYGFLGHPLRKDFPVMGFNEVFYSEIQKRIIQAPLMKSTDFVEKSFYLNDKHYEC
jgi:NADH dehydrogenase (ubiquinone) Fe-S protein 3